MSTFPELPPSVLALESEILDRWQREDTFRRSLEATAEGEPFVFYEGPPTANGRPGIHHVLSRTIKDTVARFRTMQGRWVPRMAGWDTHGLPVEIEAEKTLGISGKREIEALGIERFNQVCRESVLTYTGEWERFSARIGYWLDYSNPYVTYRAEYVESVWHILAEIARKGLVYRGHKILPYCPRCGTGLSSHEVAQGYRDVKDPSLYLTLPVLGDDGAEDGRELLVWTTTPWTLVSNVALAVSAEETYAEVEHEGRRLIAVAARVPALFGAEAAVRRTFPGAELVGLHYRRPFDWVDTAAHPAGQVERAWRVYPAGFVSAEDGTGIVHISPAFGADDYAIGQEAGLPVLRPVDDRGAFDEALPLVGGRFVKDADTDLVIDLKQRGQVFRSSKEEHSYPHCWRCQSPLLYMARDSWFIRTSAVRDELLRNNAAIRWHPPEIGTGRMGEWLENNVDWAISRNRYWGTPLPAWVCDRDPSHVEFVGSFAEVEERSGVRIADPHRPYVDEVTWPCTSCGGTMRRTPEVVDVWFDSGSMPYAQHHYPFENRDEAERQFPADFICEGVDQTRGWFYSLLAISTLLGKGVPFRNVIVNDMLLDAKGQKMSKSRGNAVDPAEAIGEFGADAVRWYLLASSNPWLPKRFDPEGIREVQRKTFDTLRQTYRFFAMYANLEEWTPDAEAPPVESRPVMDRWLLSELEVVTGTVTDALEGYDLTSAARRIGTFVVDDLSNWYVRRSRDRFWGTDDRADLAAACATLHHALVVTARLMAPLAPFTSDWLHRALAGESVHLARFPEPAAPAAGAGSPRAAMEAVRRLATLGRAAREEAGVRVRQPLPALYAVVPTSVRTGGIGEDLLAIVRDELNVKRVEFMERAEHLVTYSAKPVFKLVGQRYGGRTQAAAAAIRAMTSEQVAALIADGSAAVEHGGETFAVQGDEVEVQRTATGRMTAKAEAGYVVALETEITPELRLEGLARELVNRVQNLRKESGLKVEDRIRLGVFGDGEILDVARTWADFVKRETLAEALEATAVTDYEGYEFTREVELDGVSGTIALARLERNEG